MTDSAHVTTAPTVTPMMWMSSAADGFDHAVSVRALTAGRSVGVYVGQCGQLVTATAEPGLRCVLCEHFDRERSLA